MLSFFPFGVPSPAGSLQLERADEPPELLRVNALVRAEPEVRQHVRGIAQANPLRELPEVRLRAHGNKSAKDHSSRSLIQYLWLKVEDRMQASSQSRATIRATCPGLLCPQAAKCHGSTLGYPGRCTRTWPHCERSVEKPLAGCAGCRFTTVAPRGIARALVSPAPSIPTSRPALAKHSSCRRPTGR